MDNKRSYFTFYLTKNTATKVFFVLFPASGEEYLFHIFPGTWTRGLRDE